jgi:hypothetical protein
MAIFKIKHLNAVVVTAVFLTGCGGGGSDSSGPSVPDTSSSNAPPIASFESSCTDERVCSFTSTSTDPDGTIASVLWTFPDGSTANTTETSFTFAEYGNFLVSLEATDNNGISRVNNQTISVTVDFHSASATANLNDSSVIWSQDFNHRPDGAYTGEDLAQDLNTTSRPNIDLDKFEIQNGEIAATFTPGKIGTSVGMHIPLHFDYNELWLTFDVRFDENYDQIAKGGKLMGLGGHPEGNYPPTGCVDVAPDEGFSVRNQYRQGGQLTQYVYHQNKDENGADSGDGRTCGEQLYIEDASETDTFINMFQFKKDKIYTIELHVKMNNPQESNGIAETYINGKLAKQTNEWIFSQSGLYGINSWLFQLYIGGAQEDWELDNPSTLYLDNFALSTQRVVVSDISEN